VASLKGKGERGVYILFDHKPALSFEIVLCVNTEGLQELLPTEMGEDRRRSCMKQRLLRSSYWQHAKEAETDARLSC